MTKPGQRTFTLVGSTGVSVSYHFSTEGQLTGLELPEGLGSDVMAWVKATLPLTLGDLYSLANKSSKKLQLVEANSEVTFEQFYEAYGNKQKRARALPIWTKLSHEDRVAAFIYIAKFKKGYIAKNLNLPYPDVYLKDRRWED